MDFNPDLRVMRAQRMVALVMREIGPHLRDRKASAYVARGLMEAFSTMGVDFVTDHDRETHGLPSRDSKGWTLEELIALEQRRLEALAAPPVIYIPSFLPRKAVKED